MTIKKKGDKMETDECLKEWNATIEALGQGKQTILIRVYRTSKEKFLLYPTKNYILKEDYMNSFKEKYHPFIKEHSKELSDNVKINYYATCEKVIEGSLNKVLKLDKNYIWTKQHVKNYVKGRKLYIWILRVYKLKNPKIVNQVPGQIYGRLPYKIDLKDSKPIINDRKFEELIKEIEMSLN